MSPAKYSCTPRLSRNWDFSALFLFGFFATICLVTMSDYGMSWDEWFRWRGGQEKLLYYKDLFGLNDLMASHRAKTDNYPGLFDLSVAMINEYLGISLFHAGHSLSLGFGFLTVLAVWLLTRSVAGSRAGFLAIFFLILMPRFYGHQFFNPKDIPFACTYVWAIFAITCFLFQAPRPGWKVTLFLGASIGLCLSTRIGAIILFLYLGAVCLWLICRETSESPSGLRIKTFVDSTIGLLARCSIVGVIAFSVLAIWWPYSHSNPIARTLEVFITISDYPWDGPVLFFGDFIRASELPRSYILVWIGITLPPIIIFSMIISLAFSLRSLGKVFIEWRNSVYGLIGLIVLAVLFPLTYVILKNSTLYDGMRHLLFILPMIAILSAIGINSILENFRRITLRVASWVSIIGLAGWSIIPMVNLHPYQYVYFNPLIGGLKGATGRFETEYWATANREAVKLLQSYLQSEYPSDFRPKVFSAIPALLSRYFFPDHWIPVDDPQDADFFISTTRLNLDRELIGEQIIAVERNASNFAVVKKLNSTPSSFE